MIRTAEHTDYKQVKELIQLGVEEGTLQPRRKKDIKKAIKRGRIAVAEENGSLVGTAGIVVYDRRIAEVRSLYVTPNQRGKGIAHELLGHILESSVNVLPTATIFAITQTPRVFNQAGFSSGIRTNKSEKHIVMKNI